MRLGNPIVRLFPEGDIRNKDRNRDLTQDAIARIRDRRLKRKRCLLSIEELIACKNEGRA